MTRDKKGAIVLMSLREKRLEELMFGILLLLFTVLPAVELYILFTVGAQIGALETFLLVILTGIVGASLAKSQGLHIYLKIQQDLNAGRIPTNQFIHGLLVFGGGLLLLTPGFLTDAFGLSMVFPGTRHFWTTVFGHWFKRMVEGGNVQFHFFGQNQGRRYEYHSDSRFHQKGPRQVDNNTFETDDYELHDDE